MLSNNRYLADKKQEEKELCEARRALEQFRENGNTSGFPELRIYLWRINGHESRFASFDLSGFGYYDDWQLTKEEYQFFKTLYKKSERGKKDTCTIG